MRARHRIINAFPSPPIGLLAALLLSSCSGACGPTSQEVTQPKPAVEQEEAKPTDAQAEEASELRVDLSITPLFAAGPLAEARQHADNHEWAEAAAAFAAIEEQAFVEAAGPSLLQARLLAGYCATQAERWEEAEGWLAPAVQLDGPLNSYAIVLLAEVYLQQEKATEALALLTDFPEESVLAQRSAIDQAEALQQLERYQEADVFFRVLAKDASGSIQRRAKLALAKRALLNDRLQEAADGFYELTKDAPNTSEGRSARRNLDRILEKFDDDKRAPYQKKTEPWAEAKDLYKKHKSEEAIRAFKKLQRKLDIDKDHSRWCEAGYLIAKSYSKLRVHEKAAPVYDEVIEHCGDTDWRAKALYNAGRAYWNINADDTAIERFTTLTKDYPKLSLADDGMLYKARIYLSNGDPKRGRETLLEQVERYPKGDMVKDAHWLLFKAHYLKGELQEAIAYADEHAASLGEDDLYSQGRIAYFKARALEELKRDDEAHDTFEAVIRAYPLTYYALISWQRLAIADEARAQALLTELWPGATQASPGIDIPESVARDPHFDTAKALLEIGFFDWAQDELAEIESEEAIFELAKAALFDQAGDADRAHRVAARLIKAEKAYPDLASLKLWAIAYPRPWRNLVEKAAQEQEISPLLVYSIMREESGFKPKVESWANARGLMQVMVETGKSTAPRAGIDKFDPDDLYTPQVAIPIGAAYLSKLSGLFGGHPALVIPGYNGGQGNIRNWLKSNGELPLDLWVEAIPFGQTRHYAKRVLTTYWRYHWLYAEVPVPSFDPASPPR